MRWTEYWNKRSENKIVFGSSNEEDNLSHIEPNGKILCISQLQTSDPILSANLDLSNGGTLL